MGLDGRYLRAAYGKGIAYGGGWEGREPANEYTPYGGQQFLIWISLFTFGGEVRERGEGGARFGYGL